MIKIRIQYPNHIRYRHNRYVWLQFQFIITKQNSLVLNLISFLIYSQQIHVLGFVTKNMVYVTSKVTKNDERTI